MKAVALLSLAALTLAAMSFPQEPSGEQADKYVGLVLNVRKSCSARDNERARPRTLTEKNGAGTKLRAEQQLQCVNGGSLNFRYLKSGSVVAVTQTPPDWFTVVNVPAHANPSPGNGGGRPAGRLAGRVAEYYSMPSADELPTYLSTLPKGNSGGVAVSGCCADAVPTANSFPLRFYFRFTPRSEYTVRPESFVARWTASPDFPVTLSLRSASKGEVIREIKDVPAGSSVLVSPEARDALKRFREEHPGEDVKLVASVKYDNLESVLDEVKLRLLPAAEEQLLDEELSGIDNGEEIEQRLERADAFSHRDLFFEAADEYEAALKTSPDNGDLLIATAFAQCRADNDERAFELLRILSEQIPSLDHSAFMDACERRR